MLLKSYPQKLLFKMSVPNFYVKKRSKNYHWKWQYWNAAQSVSAKTVVQYVTIELPAEIASVKTTIKMSVLMVCPKTLSSKTVVQIVCNEMLPEKASQQNFHWKLPYLNAAQNLSAETVFPNVRTEFLAELAFEKLWLKMTVLKCCPKCIRKNSRSKCPYRTASWKSVRECYLQKWQFWKAAQNFIRKNSGSKWLYRITR